MKRKLIILSILVVFVMCAVQISNVSAQKPGPAIPTYLKGWIWYINEDSQSIYVYGGGGIIRFGGLLFVTPETQITFGAEPGTFEDLEPGQYITFSYYFDCVDDLDCRAYASRIAVTPGKPVWCPPGQDPCDYDPFP